MDHLTLYEKKWAGCHMEEEKAGNTPTTSNNIK